MTESHQEYVVVCVCMYMCVCVCGYLTLTLNCRAFFQFSQLCCYFNYKGEYIQNELKSKCSKN